MSSIVLWGLLLLRDWARTHHYAIKVKDIVGTCNELVNGGLAVDGPVYVETTKRKLATIRDPNGILVQLVEIDDGQIDC